MCGKILNSLVLNFLHHGSYTTKSNVKYCFCFVWTQNEPLVPPAAPFWFSENQPCQPFFPSVDSSVAGRRATLKSRLYKLPITIISSSLASPPSQSAALFGTRRHSPAPTMRERRSPIMSSCAGPGRVGSGRERIAVTPLSTYSAAQRAHCSQTVARGRGGAGWVGLRAEPAVSALVKWEMFLFFHSAAAAAPGDLSGTAAITTRPCE